MSERFLRNEQLCREQAAVASNAADRQSWSDMADQWAQMARGSVQTQQQQQQQAQTRANDPDIPSPYR